MKKTILFDSHKKLSARFISFAGWQMPFSYSSPSQEHLQTRQSGGLFDVSHMGQIRIKGPDSLSFLEKLLPTQLKSLEKGRAFYSVMCLPTGGIIDDLIVYVFSKEDYLLCVNAGTLEKDLKWIESQKTGAVIVEDESLKWALIAVQGPHCFDLCEKIFPKVNFRGIPQFQFIEEDFCLLSRTGYTGEDGFELYVPHEKAVSLWELLVKKGLEFKIAPVGLGARDTLRLEMAYLLSGQDFDETKTPLQADLKWLMNNPKDYIGKKALMTQKELGSYSKLQAFIMEGEGAIPRKGYEVKSLEGKVIGQVTSGAKSPSLQKMIGLAYMEVAEAVGATEVSEAVGATEVSEAMETAESQSAKSCLISVRENDLKARISPKPFLKKP